MNKELRVLEHLDFIRNYEVDDEHRTLNMNYACKQSLNIIETALKDYEYQTKLLEKLTEPKIPTLTSEEIEQLKKGGGYITEYKGIYVDENTFKKLKALEIIKRKGVNVNYLKYHFEKGNGGYREYKRVMNTPYLDYYPSAEMLTKEEFDLLKEVLS